MAWSKTTRIKVMLAIDILFFVIELSVGFAVHSLALMADAFHMVCSLLSSFPINALGRLTNRRLLSSKQLNDIISLAVGLWAVQISKKATTVQYTYGVSFSDPR